MNKDTKRKSLNELKAKQTLQYFWSHILNYKPYQWYMSFSVFVVIANNVMGGVIAPIYFADMLDALSEATDTLESREIQFPIAFKALVLYFAFELGAMILRIIENYWKQPVSAQIITNANNDILRIISEKSFTFFSNTMVGSLISKSQRLVWRMMDLINHVPKEFLTMAVMLIGTLIAISYKVPALVIPYIVWIIIFWVLLIWFMNWKRKYDLARHSAQTKTTAQFADTVSNMPTVKTFHSTERELAHYAETSDNLRQKLTTVWTLNMHQRNAQRVIVRIAQVGIYFSALYMWQSGTLSVGTIMLTHAYFWKIVEQTQKIGDILDRLYEGLAACTEMTSIIHKPLLLTDPENPEPCKISNGALSFFDVDFVYEEEGKEVFNKLNLKIPSGQKIGIVGHSGSGKSTLTKLLLRYMDIQGGEICIDGQNIAHIAQDDLRQHISYVPQESILFHRSIYDNIVYSKPDATKEDVIKAAKKAHAHEFINQLPQGYDSMVGERGVKLSGGERQRVAIARAMLKQAPILILDEATSSLDTISEKYIQESFETLMQGRTTIVIAHRLSTIQKMDRIIVLDKGQIVEEGSHTELLKKDGVYAKLCKHQQDGFLVD